MRREGSLSADLLDDLALERQPAVVVVVVDLADEED